MATSAIQHLSERQARLLKEGRGNGAKSVLPVASIRLYDIHDKALPSFGWNPS
jgi:hypothetical protein